VRVVHGDADLPLRLGHAGGRYRSDVSRWLLAWSIGVEWDPLATESTDRINAGVPSHEGRYVRSLPGSTPMESWIAGMLDHLAGLEAARGWSRPVTFTNWLTLDPMRHPEEPFPQEDLVSIDAMHLGRLPAGLGGSSPATTPIPTTRTSCAGSPGTRSTGGRATARRTRTPATSTPCAATTGARR
jgi:hypothetical protein